MKGRVFTELFEHVESRYGIDVVDDIIDAAKLPHDGVYTSTGSYPFEEMVSLITALVAATGQSLPALLEPFGTHCFESWVSYAPQYFSRDRSLFDILEGIDEFHEIEVRKLYPDAELPSFVPETRSAQALTLGYYISRSPDRPCQSSDASEALAAGCVLRRSWFQYCRLVP